MPKFEWFDSLEVGVKAIDDDHKRMMATLKRIQVAISEQNLNVCKELTTNFIGITKTHFTTEEKVLEEVNFPHLREHRVTHGQLLDQAIEIETFIHNATHVDELDGCLDGLADFLFHDLIALDMAYKSFLQKCGIAKRT